MSDLDDSVENAILNQRDKELDTRIERSPILRSRSLRSLPRSTVEENFDFEFDEENVVSAVKKFRPINQQEIAIYSETGDIEQEWETVRRKKPTTKKKKGEECGKIELYITSKNPLPKQFAMARFLNENNIENISFVKYISPFKVRLEFKDEKSSDKLFACEKITENEWMVHKAMELSYYFGVIRNVDIDLKEDEILNSIECTGKIISVKRLSRRNIEKREWNPCESIRICFKGSTLPSHVFVENLRIPVDPYIFPVSQCYKCWRIGHTTKSCPAKTCVCPKCGGEHSNCETKKFKCVNCSGRHTAFYKGCPTFMKEKRLRDIMAESCCTYRKALTIYADQLPNRSTDLTENNEPVDIGEPLPMQSPSTLYSNVVKTRAEIHTTTSTSKEKHMTNKVLKDMPKENKKKKDEESWFTEAKRWNEAYMLDNDTNSDAPSNASDDIHKVTLNELLSRVKNIIFSKHSSFKTKISEVFQICAEWIVSVAVGFLSDWPMIQKLLILING